MRVSVYELAYSTTSLLKAVAKLARQEQTSARHLKSPPRGDTWRTPSRRARGGEKHTHGGADQRQRGRGGRRARRRRGARRAPGYACQHCRALCPYNARRCGVRPRRPLRARRGARGGGRRRRARRASAPPSARRAAPGRAGPRLSPVGAFGAEIAAHLSALRCGRLTARCASCARLMQHPLNQNWFNEPVDPVRLNLPDYFAIVREPMDLGTVKSRLAAFAYSDVPALAADVRRVFDNAQRYNPPRNAVHRAAAELARDFDADLERARTLRAREPGGARARVRPLPRAALRPLRRQVHHAEAPALICSGPASSAAPRPAVPRDARREPALVPQVLPGPQGGHPAAGRRARAAAAQDAAHAQATGLWYSAT